MADSIVVPIKPPAPRQRIKLSRPLIAKALDAEADKVFEARAIMQLIGDAFASWNRPQGSGAAPALECDRIAYAAAGAARLLADFECTDDIELSNRGKAIVAAAGRGNG